MEDQTLQAKINMLEQRIAFLEMRSMSSEVGGGMENNAAVPIPAIPPDRKLETDKYPEGSGYTKVDDVHEKILLSSAVGSNVQYELKEATVDGEKVTKIEVGVYYA